MLFLPTLLYNAFKFASVAIGAYLPTARCIEGSAHQAQQPAFAPGLIKGEAEAIAAKQSGSRYLRSLSKGHRQSMESNTQERGIRTMSIIDRTYYLLRGVPVVVSGEMETYPSSARGQGTSEECTHTVPGQYKGTAAI
jgi:hypothetical protein